MIDIESGPYVVTFERAPLVGLSQFNGLRRMSLPEAERTIQMANRPGRIVNVDEFKPEEFFRHLGS